MRSAFEYALSALQDILVRRQGRSSAVMWRFDPAEPEGSVRRWRCWVEGDVSLDSFGKTGEGAMRALLAKVS